MLILLSGETEIDFNKLNKSIIKTDLSNEKDSFSVDQTQYKSGTFVKEREVITEITDTLADTDSFLYLNDRRKTIF